MRVARNYKLGTVTPPDPDAALAAMYSVLDAKWDNVITAREAKNISNTQATKGQGVYSLPARKGARSMTYSGTDNPLLGMPYYDEQINFLAKPLPFIWFKNQSNIFYSSSEDGGLSEERTWYASIMFPDYQIYEGFLKTFGTIYLGTSNARNSSSTQFDISLRTTNDDVNNVIITDFKPNAIHHVVYRMHRQGFESENPGKIGVQLWFDGVLLNPSLNKETFNTLKRIEVIGADTNCMTMGWLQLATAYRAMSTPDIIATFDAVRTYFGAFNTVIPLPTATDISVGRVGNIVTVNYVVTPSSFTEDISKRIIIWETGPSLQEMVQKHEIDNLKSFDVTTVPGAVNGYPWRCSVFVTSADNKTLKLPGIWFGNF